MSGCSNSSQVLAISGNSNCVLHVSLLLVHICDACFVKFRIIHIYVLNSKLRLNSNIFLMAPKGVENLAVLQKHHENFHLTDVEFLTS